MWCLWALPLLGLAVRVASEGTVPVSCNGTWLDVQPPLYVKIFTDEAHFVCSSGFKLQGQNILTCINTNWDHPVPVCEKLPPRTIKMKCPFDHREWTLSNLNMISSWLENNTDQEIILDNDYIDDSPESRRLAAEMFARFTDPFFRFYANLPTVDKSLPMKRLIVKFQGSLQFLQLRNRMREELVEFASNDIDEDQNVLLQYYGLHFVDVLKDIILPYGKALSERPQTGERTVPKHEETHPESPWGDIGSFDGSFEEREISVPSVTQVSTNPPEPTFHSEDGFLADSSSSSSSELADVEHASTGETRKKNVRRDKGDIEKILPPREEGKDFFARPFGQQLTGTKAADQVRMHRDSYIDYIKAIVEHIIKHKVPKEKWPESLKKYDQEELRIILEIPGSDIPETSECSPPWALGFELVSNGTAMLQGKKTVIIRCNPGFYLRGARELYCDRGRWAPRGAGMPTCVSEMRQPSCGASYPSLLNGRVIKVDVDYVVYECHSGYSMEGSRMLSCRNGQWTPTDGSAMPVCVENQRPRGCGPPPVPFNGGATEPHMMTDGRRLVVRYFCNANYSMSGEDYSICEDGQWTPYNFRCTLSGQDNVPENTEMPQKPKICTKLVVPNASVKYYEDGRSSVRVTCLPGYKMLGSGLVRCENGVYVDPIPSCVDRGAIEDRNAVGDACGTPPAAPIHGSVQPITQTSVRFSCDPGYSLVGKGRSNCYMGRWDNPTPECTLRTGCDNNDQIRNKNLFGYVYNNGRWLECIERVEMIGENQQFCRSGRWDAEPSCVTASNKTSVLYPEFIDCPLPEVPASSGLMISSRGPTIYYRCKARDNVLRGDRSNECVRGRWIKPVPYCERQGVPPTPTTLAPAPLRGCSARPIRGGEAYVYSDGRVIIYQCRINYIIRGHTMLNCERSQWSNRLPTCENAVGLAQEDGEIFYEGMRCPPPPTYPGTSSSRILNRGLRIYYNCPGGNSTIMECVDGRWRGSPPQCASTGVCEPQEIENGKFFQYRRGFGYIQCKGGFVIENDENSRGQYVTCDSDTGRWSFGLIPPKCVPDSGVAQDDRPFDAIDDTPYGNRLQIDDCGLPEIASNFSFYIQKDGRSVALGCKKRRPKRSTGSIECTNGTWEFSAADICVSECGLHDVKIEHGVKALYDDNEYVFQCFPNYELIGAPIAHCPGYLPNAQYNTSFVQQYGPDFITPECRRTEIEPRPIHGGDVLDSDAFQSCRWLAEFGKLNLAPKDFYISQHGRKVTWRSKVAQPGSDEAEESTAECRGGMWVHKAIQTRGCDTLPNEPEQGTFFLYENSRGSTSIYFQCLDGYRLQGQRLGVCSRNRVRVPECIPDSTVLRGAYPKTKNPNPLSSNRCPTPPEYLPYAEVTIHQSGDMFAINCVPGFVIANTQSRYSVVRCNQLTWSPEMLPRCVRDGDRTPLPTREPPTRDLFGRPLPQRLTGDKAERQDAQLREQFRQHAQQLVAFAKARNRELRRSGVQQDERQIKSLELPIVSSLTDEERDQLIRRNEETYKEIENLLQSIREERIRRRRHHGLTSVDSDSEIYIPLDLLPLEESIRKYNLTQEDINVMVLLGESDRLKFLDDKKNQQEKSKSDPVQSQNFVRKAMAEKKKKTSAEDSRSKSAVVDNSIETSSTTTEGTEGTSIPVTEPTTKFTTESQSTTTVSIASNAPDEATPLELEVSEESATEESERVSPQTDGSADVAAANNSSVVRKGYDDSCSEKFATAPKIENGFLVSYEIFEGAEGKVLQANYRCFEDFSFEFEHTSTVRCRNGKWVGELPTCVPDEGSDEDDEEDETNSQLNKLK